MLPTELRLLSFGDCYIRLPKNFISEEKGKIKPGSAICIRSVQTDTELLVQWNGSLNNEDFPQLDFNFGKANGLTDKELIVISHLDNWNPPKCSECRVELLDSREYSILSQHSDANLLDSCKLVFKGLVIPIKVSQHVQVLVKVVNTSPDSIEFGCILTKWTEMHFQHSLTNEEKLRNDEIIHDEEEDIPILRPYPFVSLALGIGADCDTKSRLFPGAMLICGERGSGKTYLLKSIIHDYRKYHSQYLDCNQLRGKRIENIKKTFDESLVVALENEPSIIALDDIDSFVGASESKNGDEKGQEAIYRRRLVTTLCYLFKRLERLDGYKNRRIALLATARSLKNLDDGLVKPKGRRYFNEIMNLGVLSQSERQSILKCLISERKQMRSSIEDSQLEKLAKKCASFMAQDLRLLVDRAIISASSRSLHEFNSDPLTLEVGDLEMALVGYTPINLRGVSLKERTRRSLDQVGGMKRVKETLVRTVLMQIRHPRLFSRCPIKPQSSILLYGPSGCGKTCLAEALTNEEGINSICVKGPDLLEKYIGASERNVRDLFHRAKLARPCVIFFDEFEALVPRRGSDSTGVTDRVVNQFLTLMDGVEGLGEQVFLLAASSRRDLIDPAILRPGRMDQHIFCPPPDADERLEILQIKSRDFRLDDACNLERWAARLEHYTGADIKSLLGSALIKSIKEQGAGLAAGGDFDQLVEVTDRHLETAHGEMAAGVEARYQASLRGSQLRVGSRATLS